MMLWSTHLPIDVQLLISSQRTQLVAAASSSMHAGDVPCRNVRMRGWMFAIVSLSSKPMNSASTAWKAIANQI